MAVGEVAHGELGGIDAVEQHGTVAHQHQRRMQRVLAPAQGPQLCCGLGAVGGPAEAPVAQRQRLVGAQYQLFGHRSRHALRLGARQDQRGRRGIELARRPGLRFDRALVDRRRPDGEAQARRRQHPAAYVAA
jgi:hypothetical protein